MLPSTQKKINTSQNMLLGNPKEKTPLQSPWKTSKEKRRFHTPLHKVTTMDFVMQVFYNQIVDIDD